MGERTCPAAETIAAETIAAESLAAESLAAEWERVEYLALVAAAQRRGTPLAGEARKELSTLQSRVDRLRSDWAKTAWANLPLAGIPSLAWEVLACVLAPECMPKIALLFCRLQGGDRAHPSAALIQELLGLDANDARDLMAQINITGFLRDRGLLANSPQGPLDPIRPAAGLAAALMGRPQALAVPGAALLKQQGDWEDLVLSADRKAMLREFIFWVRHRGQVVEQWGGRDTGGPLALFSGPSGTGKTFAAGVVAGELGWPLYRVNLGRLVSKYIGETEKNLNALFDAAHGKKAVLQFDEADSLFGKRGEVRDARDRYANMEVSHLLARIETHRGPCILTTNLRGHLDPAFTRRFQMIIPFCTPDENQRTLLWEKHLPPGAPLAHDLDIRELARSAAVNGGSIRNAALHAAFLAAAKSGPIGPAEAALALWREIGKDGRKHTPADLGPLAHHLDEMDIQNGESPHGSRPH
ncbi:MAG: ATP-binding protein [Desulfobacter sp.]|nr:MAG: ATP-binding protein [Desulfobacter sp.]